MSKAARVLYWFRTDLRVTDSPALEAALGIDGIEAFYPVWCFDPEYVWKHKVGTNRWSFLLQSMSALSAELTTLNPSQRLLVLRGSPEAVLPLAWEPWGITHIVWERDSSGYARRRDRVVMDLAREKGVEVVTRMGHNLIDPVEVVKMNAGKPTTTVAQWKKAAAKVGAVPQPVPMPTSLPDPGPLGLTAKTPSKAKGKGKAGDAPTAVLEGVNVNEEIMDEKTFTCFDDISGPDHDFSVPTMPQLGLPASTTHILGGTAAAHAVLNTFLSSPSRVATFSKPHTAPTALEPSTTLLSPYIKFGCVSVREVWWGCKRVVEEWERAGGRGKTGEPENMFGQLEFREMYYCAELGAPGYDRVRGNPICRFINWHLPNVYDQQGELILPRPRGEEKHEERFLAWKEGRTGFPWIDAVMRQLRQEGWIHHLARHSVACFLTRGQLYISWERGAEVFDEYLLDWDPASNPGNWMWLSCSAFFSQYFRVYGLVSWPLKTDKKGLFVRKYCPELKGFPDKYIYEPHKAPLAVQKSAGCIIGEDYPFPIIDEQSSKTRNIERLKIAFSAGIHGDDKRVMDGTAPAVLEGLFRDKHGREEGDEGEGTEVGVKRKRGGEVKEGPMDAFVKKKRGIVRGV